MADNETINMKARIAVVKARKTAFFQEMDRLGFFRADAEELWKRTNTVKITQLIASGGLTDIEAKARILEELGHYKRAARIREQSRTERNIKDKIVFFERMDELDFVRADSERLWARRADSFIKKLIGDIQLIKLKTPKEIKYGRQFHIFTFTKTLRGRINRALTRVDYPKPKLIRKKPFSKFEKPVRPLQQRLPRHPI